MFEREKNSGVVLWNYGVPWSPEYHRILHHIHFTRYSVLCMHGETTVNLLACFITHQPQDLWIQLLRALKKQREVHMSILSNNLLHLVGSLLKPWHSASGRFTMKNISDFVIGVHIPMCSHVLLKLGDNKSLLNCSIVIRYLGIWTVGQDFTQI